MEQNQEDVAEDEIWHNLLWTKVMNNRRYTKDKKCQAMISAERKMREANCYNYRRLQDWNCAAQHWDWIHNPFWLLMHLCENCGFSGEKGTLVFLRNKKELVISGCQVLSTAIFLKITPEAGTTTPPERGRSKALIVSQLKRIIPQTRLTLSFSLLHHLSLEDFSLSSSPRLNPMQDELLNFCFIKNKKLKIFSASLQGRQDICLCATWPTPSEISQCFCREQSTESKRKVRQVQDSVRLK